jgi:hypothetical protein
VAHTRRQVPEWQKTRIVKLPWEEVGVASWVLVSGSSDDLLHTYQSCRSSPRVSTPIRTKRACVVSVWCLSILVADAQVAADWDTLMSYSTMLMVKPHTTSFMVLRKVRSGVDHDEVSRSHSMFRSYLCWYYEDKVIPSRLS